MRQYMPYLLVPLALAAGCSRGSGYAARALPATTAAAEAADLPAHGGIDPLKSLDDEFDDPGTLRAWRRVHRDEGWGAEQLERFDVGGTRPGWMLMVPHASTWYRDYRGVLAYKPVEGDFVVTTRLIVSARQGSGPPRSPFSLAGIMVRAPRGDSARDWAPGRENYVFLSLGAADRPGTFQFEAKTTTDSDSQLVTSPAPSGEALIRVARIGGSLILLRNTGAGWEVHGRYWRPDLPARVQAGLTCYTDWPSANRLSPREHNGTVLRGGDPDLRAFYDFVRFRRPRLPAALAGKRLADPSAVPDAELLRFLGGAAAG